MDEKSVFWQMYYGGRGTSEYCQLSKETRAKAGIVSEKYKKLQAVLQTQKEIWRLFEEFEDAIAEYHSEETAERYFEAFKFGLLLGIEAGGTSPSPKP